MTESSQGEIEKLSPLEVKQRLEENPDIKLLDVRQQHEYDLVNINQAVLVNDELAQEIVNSWDKNTPIILHCHHGMRSMSAALYFQQQGFTNLANMEGGIDQWAIDVDTSLPRY